MATLNETINQVQNVFNDIESALQEQGVDTSNMKPVDYANAVRGIVNNVTVENVSFLPVMIFCYSPTVPTKPVGGNWVQNEYTNQITPPDGWYLDLNDIEDASIGQDNIYMSVCIFKHDNTKYLDWTTPVRISGKDGKDGKTGKQGPAGNIAGVVIEYNTPLYAVTAASQAPDKPNCTYDLQNNSLLVNSEGWSLDTPDENSLGANILWQSIARYYSDKQTVVCSNPVRISAGNPDVFKENGFYTEYCITKEINGAKTEWFTPASADPPVPTLSSPFLWARDVMSTTVSGKHIGPVYLFATYSAGLIGIDVSYTCASSRDALDALDESLWFNDSESALTPDATKEYQGLTEDTKYLWAREQFLYSNKEPDIQYRIVSTFTAAEKAAIVYSAGTFNEKVKYTRTEEQTPYVFFADGVTLDENNKYSDSGKKYYYFVLKYSYDDDLYKIIPTNNTYPSIKDLYINSTASNKKCNWEKMESFDAIYSDIGVFKAASVGKFVFDDKYIFSQQGVDKTGTQRNYTEFSEWSVGTMNDGSSRKGVALAIETGEFIPNILLNAVDGSGKLAGGNISWDSNGTTLFGNPNDGYMQIQGGKLKLTGSIDMGVNKDSLLEWGAFSEVKNGIDKNISDLQKEVTSTIPSSLNTLDTKVANIESNFEESVSEINSRLDGVVENHFYEGAPTIDNYPAMLWSTDNEKRNHIGDTYTNIATTGSDAGKSWRWTFTDNEHTGYHWHPIADTDAVKALLEASKAQATADGKARIFVLQPIPPYSIGDLWVEGAGGDIKKCKVERLSGSYVESDWENASKYTDDTKANTAHELANKVQQDVDDLQYLSQTFGNTVDVEGVVMSQMVAVKNDSGDVEALINGDSDFAHSLMIAAGIPEKVTVNNEDNYDLEQRAIKAKFKVYEDGTLSATDAYISGQINATDGGKIGPLNIVDNGLTMMDWPDDITAGRTFPSVVLGLEFFGYSTMRAHNSNNATSVKGVTIYNNDIVTSPSIFAYKDNEYCNSNYAAIEADCEGGDASKRYAFRARNGMFAGLRPRTRAITSSTPSSELELTAIDHTIIVEASCTLYLPETPQIGQRYEIIKLYSVAVNIDPQGVQVYSMPDHNGNNGLGTNVAKLGTNAFLKATYIYTGSKWIRMIESYG